MPYQVKRLQSGQFEVEGKFFGNKKQARKYARKHKRKLKIKENATNKPKNDMSKEGFLYIWINDEDQKTYIGIHGGEACDGYIASGYNFNKSIYNQQPDKWKRKILKIGSYGEMAIREGVILNVLSAGKDKRFLNIHEPFNSIFKFLPKVNTLEDAIEISDKIISKEWAEFNLPEIKVNSLKHKFKQLIT
jgi:hypothetical protein